MPPPRPSPASRERGEGRVSAAGAGHSPSPACPRIAVRAGWGLAAPHRTRSLSAIAPSGRPDGSITGSRSARRAIIAASASRSEASAGNGSPSAVSPRRTPLGDRAQRQQLQAARRAADKLGDKIAGRPLDDLERRAPLREPSPVQHADNARQLQRLVDVVRDEHDRFAGLGAGCAAARPAMRRARSGPMPRTVRPSAAGRGRPPAPAPPRRAAARRRKAGAGIFRDMSSGSRRSSAAIPRPGRARALAASPGGAARSRYCPRPANAETGRPTGSRSRCGGAAPPAAGAAHPRRRPGSCRNRTARAGLSCARSSICRSRTAPAARRTRPPARSATDRPPRGDRRRFS